MKTKTKLVGWAAILLLLLLAAFWVDAQTHVAALVNQANTFTQANTFLAGVVLPGATTGTVQVQGPAASVATTYVLPGTAGQTGYALCIGSNPGVLAYCPPAGGGGGAAAVNQSPTSLSFGSVPHGTASSPQVVNVANSGTALLTFTGTPFTFTGTNAGDFSQANSCSATLDAGSVCTVTVTFSPATAGSKTATLNINDSAASSPQVVSLSGTGT